MRKISSKAIVQFASLTLTEAAASIWLSSQLLAPRINPDYRGVVTVVTCFVVFYALSIAVFRLLQRIAPVPTGEIPEGSVGEHRAFLYMLHFIMLFNPLLFGRFIPFPAMRLLLQSLGARLGTNTYSAGLVMDPQFTVVGNDSVIGNDAMLIAHVIEGNHLAYHQITIGNHVTIGARAIILSGVTIEDDAVIGMQAVVQKGAVVRQGETWVGCPARCLQKGALGSEMTRGNTNT